MDSGNSGSVQSSSGGSEEFDSRADSISAFFNSNPSSHIGQQPPVMSQSMLFDPLSNFFDHPLSSATNRNPQLNLDAIWSKNIRSEPNCNDLGGFMASQQAQSRVTFSSVQIPQGPESGTKASVSGTTDQQPNNNTVRNSKKRSRASRRAPTTVLTTDTTNFRAMVQEFTGIPAPPFTSLPFPRTRVDLLGTSSTMRPTQLDPSSPHYVLRPFAQKLHYPPPFTISSSSMVDAIASTPSTNSTSSTTSINYQLPSELGFLKQLPQYPLNNISMQNPILKMGVFEELGLSQGHGNTNLGGVQAMVPSSDDQSVLRSVNGSYSADTNTQRVTNGKGNNFPVASSDFQGDKGPENVGIRSEGMVESWICSSD
ncbi:hypothetical protein like AT5G65170 [Hibiscus trionum]|uniref:VQ domain-containing protein n=1 Tax=Hibiscus trionum TaxID=183268 RepID=A0A9W7LKE1_HIBTR|nr:hypothetical protein like AT5G65170 [Hibiscus trionum]